MNNEICPCCQQVFSICECEFEKWIDYFRKEDKSDYHNEVDIKPNDKAAKMQSVNYKANSNRFSN